MKLPESVKIGAWHYKVIDWKPTEAANQSKFGTCSTNDKQIRVDTLWGRKKAAHTLLHEIMHGVDYEWNIQDGDSGERRVASFADGLSAVIHDNPSVFRWIVSGISQDG